MSFLYKTTPVFRTAVRSSVVRSSPRLFSTTVVQQKNPAEVVKDGLKTVDRTISDAAVAGIDKGSMEHVLNRFSELQTDLIVQSN